MIVMGRCSTDRVYRRLQKNPDQGSHVSEHVLALSCFKNHKLGGRCGRRNPTAIAACKSIFAAQMDILSQPTVVMIHDSRSGSLRERLTLIFYRVLTNICTLPSPFHHIFNRHKWMRKPWFDRTARLRMRSWSRFDLLSYNIHSVGRFHHPTLREVFFIGRLRLSSRPATLIFTLPQACRNLRLIHDTPRKQTSPETWYFLLVSSRRILDCLFLLWYVLLAHGIWHIHKFN